MCREPLIPTNKSSSLGCSQQAFNRIVPLFHLDGVSPGQSGEATVIGQDKIMTNRDTSQQECYYLKMVEQHFLCETPLKNRAGFKHVLLEIKFVALRRSVCTHTCKRIVRGVMYPLSAPTDTL